MCKKVEYNKIYIYIKTQNYGLKMNLPNTRAIFKYLRKNLSQFKMGQILKFSLKYIDRYVIKPSSHFILKTGPRCAHRINQISMKTFMTLYILFQKLMWNNGETQKIYHFSH